MNRDIEKIKNAVEKYETSSTYGIYDFEREILNIVEEIEKVTVPKEFDEWFQAIVEEYTFKDLCNMNSAKEEAIYLVARAGYGYPLNKRFDSEEGANRELFHFVLKDKILAIRAILDGYEVETEPLYCLYDSISDRYLSRNPNDGKSYDWYRFKYDDGRFTEKEIIEKFGRKYLPFKVPADSNE